MSVLDPRRSVNDAQGRLADCHSRVATAAEAIGSIRAGQRVFIGSGCGQPQALVAALLARAEELPDVEIVHLVTLALPGCRHEELARHFHLRPFFIGDGVSPEMRRHLGGYTPLLLSDIPDLLRSGRLPVDVALLQVTEPDEHGLCSLGISVDVTRCAAENAALVIAQVNPRMPWTTGDSLIDANDLDILVPVEEPLLEAIPPELGESSRRIAEHVAGLVTDGSTLQLGARGMLPALWNALQEKHDLGVHTEMIGDGIIDLMEAGVITGARKSRDRGKVVCGMCLGTKKLYDYLDRNPAFSFRSAEYLTDPAVISGQTNMVAIGVASEIDLLGHVCAQSPEGGFSGLTGHADFIHGASRARGGKLIVALESTRSDGTASRIVSHLARGAVVAATCHEVHYVVTEHGVAYLHGKSLQERVIALISIAHPDFRAGLLREAIEHDYVSTDLAGLEGRIHVGPPPLRTSLVLRDGTLVSFRPMHPTDEGRIQELFHSLSRQTMYYRFMADVTRLPHRTIQNLVYIDYRDEMAIVGTIPEASGEEIIAIGRYYLIPDTNLAEVAFIVRDEWQKRGIGTFLLKYLATIAQGQGIAGFTAEVLAENMAMLAVLRNSGFRISSRLAGRTHSIELSFQ